MNNRDDFPAQVKRTVAERAGYICSRPECRQLTIGPHSSQGKSLSSGVAAHICAAAPGGPRFDHQQTQETRTSISNAIWLCHNCSDLIDKDETRYTKMLLLQWKQDHENWVSAGGGIPTLPEISLHTIRGLSLPRTGPAEVTGYDVASYREHHLAIKNKAGKAISQLQCRIQFPEPILEHNIRIVESPVGVDIRCKPDSARLVVMAQGQGSSVRIVGEKTTALDYKVAVDKLPVAGEVIIYFISVIGLAIRPYPVHDVLEHHILGSFQYSLYGNDSIRKFLVPLEFNRESREISSLPCEEDDGTRKIMRRESW